MRLVAITHVPTRALERGERTYVDRSPIDFPLAQRQHEEYRALLAACGAEVTVLDASRDCPDAVFVEDTAVVLDEIAVIASPGAVSRRGETAAVAAELRKHREVREIRLPATLDGGDVVIAGRTLFVGASARTNVSGAEALATFAKPFGYRVVRVPIRDCLHLKSACCALPDGRLLINPSWVDASALPGFTHVHIPPDEPFGADFAIAGETVIVSTTNPSTAQLIASLGFTVRATPLSEFEKAEGGVSCLSIIFRLMDGATT